MAGKKINDLTALGRDLASTDLLELSLAGGTGSRKITGQQILNSAKSGLVPTTRTLTINGTTQDLSADRTFTVSTGITIGTTAITLGTVGRVLFEGTGNVVQESANLFWDNTNGRLGIGTSTPESQNHILSNNSNVIQLLETNNGVTTSLTGLLSLKTSFATTPSNNAGPAILFQLKVGATTNSLGYINTVRWNNNAGGLMQLATNANGVIEPKLNIFPNGNVLIQTGGVTTDAGFRLDVNGTARVQGQITTTTANAQFGTIGAATGEFRIDGVNGAGYAFSVYSSNTLRFGVVGFGGVLMPSGFTIVSGSTDITTTRLRIGTGNSTGAINIMAQSGNTDIVSFKASNATDQFTIKNTSGNTLIGTSTDAGFKLDVNGTARVQDTLTVTSTSSNGALSLTQNTVGNVAQYINRANITNAIAILSFQDLKAGTNSRSFSLGMGRSGDPQWTNGDFIFAYYAGSGSWQQSAKIFNASGNWSIENGTATSDITTAILQVNSTTKGFLPPRMTTTQINAIVTPADGLQVYNTTISHMCVYQAGSWVKINHSPM